MNDNSNSNRFGSFQIIKDLFKLFLIHSKEPTHKNRSFRNLTEMGALFLTH